MGPKWGQMRQMESRGNFLVPSLTWTHFSDNIDLAPIFTPFTVKHTHIERWVCVSVSVCAFAIYLHKKFIQMKQKFDPLSLARSSQGSKYVYYWGYTFPIAILQHEEEPHIFSHTLERVGLFNPFAALEGSKRLTDSHTLIDKHMGILYIPHSYGRIGRERKKDKDWYGMNSSAIEGLNKVFDKFVILKPPHHHPRSKISSLSTVQFVFECEEGKGRLLAIQWVHVKWSCLLVAVSVSKVGSSECVCVWAVPMMMMMEQKDSLSLSLCVYFFKPPTPKLLLIMLVKHYERERCEPKPQGKEIWAGERENEKKFSFFEGRRWWGEAK